MFYTIFLLSASPTPIIPPIAPAVTKIKSLISVDAPGALPKAIIPISVNSKNIATPHNAPIKIPFLPSFLAEKKPPKKEPTAMETDANIVAEVVGKI